MTDSMQDNGATLGLGINFPQDPVVTRLGSKTMVRAQSTPVLSQQYTERCRHDQAAGVPKPEYVSESHGDVRRVHFRRETPSTPGHRTIARQRDTYSYMTRSNYAHEQQEDGEHESPAMDSVSEIRAHQWDGGSTLADGPPMNIQPGPEATLLPASLMSSQRTSPLSTTDSAATPCTMPGSAGSLLMRRLATVQDRVGNHSHALRQAQSMSNLYGGYLGAGMMAAAMRDRQGPPSLDLLRAQHIALHGSTPIFAEGTQMPHSAPLNSPPQPPSPSRLPVFLQQRQQALRKGIGSPTNAECFTEPADPDEPSPSPSDHRLRMPRTRSAGVDLERPKSTMELSQVFAVQTRSKAPPSPSRNRNPVEGMNGVVANSSGISRQVGSRHPSSPGGTIAALSSLEAIDRPVSLIENTRAVPASQPSQPVPRGHLQLCLRSHAGMHGLRAAESGSRAVVLDPTAATGFAEGVAVTLESAGADGRLVASKSGARLNIKGGVALATSDRKATGRNPKSRCLSEASTLARQNTLLTLGDHPGRSSQELSRILAPLAGARLSNAPNSSDMAGPAGLKVSFEGARPPSKSRVEMDVFLDSSLLVEGGELKGRMEIKVAHPDKKQGGAVWLGEPKIRLVGFEELPASEARHIFFHHATTLSSATPANGANGELPFYASTPDCEGFRRGKAGSHAFPFRISLPIGKGAKGSWKGKQGSVRYIVIGSIKLKSSLSDDKSIAHFYRHIEVYPYYKPEDVLAPAAQPLKVHTAKGLLFGGNGKVHLTAQLHRGNWVAGQRCYVDIQVQNDASKKIKTLSLSLIRSATVFRPRPTLGLDGPASHEGSVVDIDEDACQTQTTRKKIAESTVEMGKKGHKGGVTAKGMWMGVDPGETVSFSHFLLVPPEALSILRGRHLEVTYSLKVSVGGSFSSDVSLEIPIRIINFVSLDPPPGHIGTITNPTPVAHEQGGSSRLYQKDASTPSAYIKTTRSAALGRSPPFDPDGVTAKGSIRTILGAQQDSVPSIAVSAPQHSGRCVPFCQPTTGSTFASNTPAHIIDMQEGAISRPLSLDCIDTAILQSARRRPPGCLTRTKRPVSPLLERSTSESALQSQRSSAHSRSDVDSPPFEKAPTPAEATYLDELEDILYSEAHSPTHGYSLPRIKLDPESDDEINAVLSSSRFDDDDEGHLLLGASGSPGKLQVVLSPPAIGRDHVSSSAAAVDDVGARQDVEANATARRHRKVQVQPPSPRPPTENRKVSRALPVPSRLPGRSRAVSRAGSGALPRPDAGVGVRCSQSTRARVFQEVPGPSKNSWGLIPQSKEGKTPPIPTATRPCGPTPSPLSPPELVSDGASSPATTELVISPDFNSNPPTAEVTREVGTRDLGCSVTGNKVEDSTHSVLPVKQRMNLVAQQAIPDTSSPSAKAVLPSVRSKIAALESRQITLKSLYQLSSERGPPVGSHCDSISSKSSSVMPALSSNEEGVSRTASLASFKAPLLKRLP